MSVVLGMRNHCVTVWRGRGREWLCMGMVMHDMRVFRCCRNTPQRSMLVLVVGAVVVILVERHFRHDWWGSRS